MSKILIIYPYFTPAQRAGGIVSSLSSLISNLPNLHFDVLTSAYDLDGSLLNVNTDNWVTLLPNCRVWYQTADAAFDLNKTIASHHYSTIYINGIYGLPFFLSPLLRLRRWKKQEGHKLVIAPRGMLQAGSLKIKQLKKKFYLTLLKLSGLLNRVHWHATDAQEVEDIRKVFGRVNVIKAIDSPPLRPVYGDITQTKKEGSLKLVFLSLITEKKNLWFLLSIIDSHPDLTVLLDIYGPVKDYGYWESCQSLIQRNSTRITYKGEVTPPQVPEVLRNYDLFVLPTHGENFGHAIFEALVAGKPVIITPFTPWQELEERSCGATLPLNADRWTRMLQMYINMKPDEYLKQCINAQNYIRDFLSSLHFDEEYQQLFLAIQTPNEEKTNL